MYETYQENTMEVYFSNLNIILEVFWQALVPCLRFQISPLGLPWWMWVFSSCVLHRHIVVFGNTVSRVRHIAKCCYAFFVEWSYSRKFPAEKGCWSSLHPARVLFIIKMGRGMQTTCSGSDLETVPTSSPLSACKHSVCKNQSIVLLTHRVLHYCYSE